MQKSRSRGRHVDASYAWRGRNDRVGDSRHKKIFRGEGIMSNVSTAQLDLAQQTYGPIVGNRLVQLAAVVMAMVVISNFQYAFTLFTPGLKQQFADAPYSD